jgi:putative membrane protein
MRYGRYITTLAVLYAALWSALAVAPHDRHDWLLENLLVFGAVVLLAATFRSLPLSRISYTLIFLFLCLHSVGAHYTYSLVPYDQWMATLTGAEIGNGAGLERNHFDRFVHFCYGLLLAYPVREMFLRVAAVRGFWGYFLPLDLTMSTSMGYELLEWGAAEIFGGDLGVAFLGTQGDPWDSQKDMALASLGAVVAMTVTAGLNRYLQRDFALEWTDSLKVKRHLPLGEIELAKLWRRHKRQRDSHAE